MTSNINTMASNNLNFSDKLFCVATGKCPRCGKGHHFEGNNPLQPTKFMNVQKRCSNCDLNFEPEIGFYWGATYVSYMMTVAFSLTLFVASVIFFGFFNTLNVKFVIVNAISLVILAPVFVRLSRTMWLWWFYVDKA